MAFDNIKLEKGLYTTGKSFTAALEELDPTENYKGTSFEGLDAYERQLKRFDIKVSGSNSDPVAKFFATTDSAALFPEYVARAVRTGIENNAVVDDIVATVTEIDSMDYRSIKTDFTKDDINLSDVAEGEQIPELTIKLSDKLTKLKKHGKMLVASYEAIKFQKLDLFTTVLRQIGNHISRQELLQAISTVDEDDGVKHTGINSADFNYEQLVKLWTDLTPYNMNTLAVGVNELAKILSMSEFRDANAGLNFHSTGNIVTPFGAKIVLVNELKDAILSFDKNFAFEKVQAGGVITEFDKLIDRQLERATVSTITGFSVIYDDAVNVLEFNQ